MSKNTILMIVSLTVLTVFAGGCSVDSEYIAGTKGKVNPYPFETAKIDYKLEGNLSGEQTVYIKGDMSAHRTVAEASDGGETKNINLLYVEAGPYRYEIDMENKSGIKTPNPIYEEMNLLSGSEKTDFLTRLATFTEEGAPLPSSKGEKSVAGQTCLLYDITDMGEICLWNGIPLYSKLSLLNGEIENIMTAVSVETGIAVDDSVFEIPAEVAVSEPAAA